MSRLRAAIVLFAVVAAGLVAPTQARAATVGLLDRDVLELNTARTAYSRASGPEEVSSATVSPTNQIVLTTSNPVAPTVTLTLGDGTRPQSGGYYALGKTTNNRISGICGGQSDGHLAVDHVAYSGDTVTELYARYGTGCSLLGWSSGLIRVGVATPYAVVRTAPVAVGRVPASRQTVTPVRFVNGGTGTTGTLAAATVGTNIVGQTDFSIVSDGCGGRTLAPNEDCTVDVGFTRGTQGTSYSLVKVGDVTYPGRLLVTGITATAFTPPTAPAWVRGFAVRGGEGLAWGQSYTDVDSFRVLRASGTDWVDASGSLPASTLTWVDTTLAPGQSGTYSVVANNLAGDGPMSEPTTVTRPAADAIVGSTDALTLDLRPDDPESWIAPVRKVGRDILIPDSADSPGPQSIRLVTPELTITIPSLIPGPGRYSLTTAGGSPDTSLSVSDLSCGGAPVTLDVSSVSYTPTGALETLTADYRVVNCGGATGVGHINYHSPDDVAVLTMTPNRSVLAQIPVGATSETAQLDVVNLGGLTVPLGARTLGGAAARDWSVVSDSCGDTLPPGATCSIQVRAVPTRGGDRDVSISFTDTTLFGSHSALVKVHAVGVPSAPTNVTAIRLPHGGVDLAWDWPTDTGGEGATRWYVRRQVGGEEQTFIVDQAVWVDPAAPFGATYTVSMENSIGESPQSAPVTPAPTADALAVKSPIEYGGPTPKLAALAVPDGLEPVPWSVPGLPDEVISASSSPDGRELATVRYGAGGAYEIWRHAVAAGSKPVKMWSTPLRVIGVAWSPDGARLAVWTSLTTECCPPTTQVVDVVTGKVVSSSAGVGGASWLPDSRTLVASAEDSDYALVRVDASTGRRLGPITGSPRGVWPTVSPDGRWLTWNEPVHHALSIAPLLGGTPHEVALYRAGRPVWAPDARSFVVTGPETLFGSLNVVTIANTGVPSVPAAVELNWGATPGPMAWVGRQVAIKAVPSLLGTVATASIDAVGFPTGTALTCAVDAGAFTPCTSTWRTPALSSGVHTLRARTVETSGRTTVTARTVVIDAAAPVAKVTALPTALLASSTTLRFSASDTGGSTVASYDVRYRAASPAGSFSAPSQPAAWQGLKTTALAVTLGKGYTYCYSVRARDIVGNIGVWTAETCTSTGLDDRSLTATGWTRAASASYYLGTYTTVATSGRVMSVRASARQVGLVVTTCSACGTLDVRLAGAYLGRRSLASSSTRVKQVIWLPLGALRTGTLTLTTVGTKRVHVDGLVLRH